MAANAGENPTIRAIVDRLNVMQWENEILQAQVVQLAPDQNDHQSKNNNDSCQLPVV